MQKNFAFAKNCPSRKILLSPEIGTYAEAHSGGRSLRLDDEIGSRRAKEEYLPSKDERLSARVMVARTAHGSGFHSLAWVGCATNIDEAGAAESGRRPWRGGRRAGASSRRRRLGTWVGARGLTQTGEIPVRVRPEARRIFELRVFSSRFDEVY